MLQVVHLISADGNNNATTHEVRSVSYVQIYVNDAGQYYIHPAIQRSGEVGYFFILSVLGVRLSVQ